MADTALKLVLLGQDKTASKALKGVGNEAGKTHGKLGKLGGMAKGAGIAIAAGLLVAGAAAVKFGGDSIAAFQDADKSQKKLEDAYRRFPKVQNVSIESMRKYNDVLERKRGIDADDTAAAQAQLGAYKLTGKQIMAMTPLLQDYAAKTGKDLPTAAKDLGKAVMGQGKALKGLGINFKDAKDPAKNYAQVMAGLKDKVGGFADSVPTAEKKSKILAATFGNLQESVGEKLQPALLGLMDAGQGVIDWLDANPAVAKGASAAFDLVGSALGGLWDIIRKYVLPGLAFLVRGFAQGVSGVRMMLEALGKIPGFEWATKAAEQVGAIESSLKTVASGMEALSREPKVDTGAVIAKQQVKELDKQIKGLKGKQVEAKAKGDTKEVDKLQKRIDKLKGKKIDINAHVRKTGINGIRVRDIGVSGGKRISVYASGHPSTPGGMAWVGDAGPELLELPTGSRVHSNGQSRALAGQSGGSSGPVIQANFSGRAAPPKEFAKYIESELYKLWRSNGRKFRWDR